MPPIRGGGVRPAFDALDRHSWDEAFAAFAAADAEGLLDADALEGFAMAAFWAGHADECLKAWERAYAAHFEAGNELRAAAAALHVARRHTQRVNPAQARGWRATAERLLERHPDSPERGRLLNQEAYGLVLAGSLGEARLRAAAAYEIGTSSRARDVQAIALNFLGQVSVRLGEVEEGLRMIDESCAQAAAGVLDAYETALLYCTTIGLCRDLADYERARELTESTAAYCDANALTSFPGICRIHRAELFRLHGKLAEAEVEAQSALGELLPRTLFWAARAFNEIGMLKLREGALEAAQAAFERARELGAEAEPGLSLVLLALGRKQAAVTQLTRALERRPADVLDRAALLSALAEAALACSELATADTAVEELEAIAETVKRPAFQAAAASARGALLLAERKPGDAVAVLRRAIQLWLSLDAPYEGARARLVIAEAHHAEGDQTGAAFELGVAARAFKAIGARRDAALAEAALRSRSDGALQALTRRQQEVARLVSEGRSNREIAGRLFLSERTAEYHVQQILNRLGLESRAQIAAWYARSA